MFHLPDGMIYLDGNSLGPMPLAACDHVSNMMRDEWGEMLITGWNRGGRDGAGWMAMPTGIGDRIARLIGAEPGHVVMGDTLSIKVYQALASALEMNPKRKVVLSDSGNFPWTVLIEMGKTDDRRHMIFDSACHEGHYGLTGILVGSRREEQAAK